LRDAENNLHARATTGMSAEEDARLRAAPVPFAMFQHMMQPEMRLSRSYLFDHRYHSSPPELADALNIPPLPPDWREGQWHPEDSLTVPLEDRDGHCAGLISVDRPRDRGFPDLTRVQALELFANHCVVAVEQARLYEEMRSLAMTDALTGLPNRMLLHDRLRQALALAQREGTSLALMLMDLDRFKEVNDTLGHHYGDILLQQVGARVRAALRTSDTVARLGGDEFAVILPVTDEAGAALAARNILAALEPPVVVDGHALDIRASIGVAIFPQHGDDAPGLLRRADVAMYVAKRARGGLSIYHEEHDHHSPRRLALMTELRQSLDNNGLRLHYQPLIDLSQGHVTGVEALLRWPHPEQGSIAPDQFIPLAEHTDLIVPLTQWVLETAIRQCAAWRRAGLDLGVSVNLSARLLHDIHLPDIVRLLLSHSAVAPGQLTLEITESALMDDPDQALDVLKRLDHIGVRMSIDDFGAGYSSLSYLKRLPVHDIKIDKSFVLGLGATTNLKDAAIVRSVIAMAQALSLKVVAEGVERREAWDVLHALGCDVAQGYYISRALPPAELEQWLRSCAWAPVHSTRPAAVAR
ncbi:MAG: EAL domain-containing protein, partial [Chloroflexi bacterium]|nr:EAL domain-containing protein [Chloroflexota bacterium]